LTASAVAVRAGKIRVDLVLPGPGAVTVRAAARVRGHAIAVGRRTQSASTAGSLAIIIKPRAAARRALRAHRRLKATVKVTFAPGSGGAAEHLTRSVVLHR
jgi:hypothetical protein